MLILSSLSLLANSLVSFFGINVGGVPYVVDNNSSIDSQCYIVETYTPRKMGENLSVSYGDVALNVNPSSSNFLYLNYFDSIDSNFTLGGTYNMTNYSDTGNPYYNFSYYWRDCFQVTINFTNVRNNQFEIRLYQYKQVNVYMNIYTTSWFIHSNNAHEYTNYNLLHYSLLKPVSNSFNYSTYTFNHPYSNYGNYCVTAIEFGIEDSSITNYMNNSGDSYQSGYDSGYSTGYDDGYSNGNNNGYSSGYSQGSSDGYNSGYSTGYSEGVTQQNTQFINLFGAVADTPVIMFYRLFNFDLFGTSVIVIVLSLFTALVLLGILRRFLK